MSVDQRQECIRELHRQRPRSLFLSLGGVLFTGLVLFAWLSPTLHLERLFTTDRAAQLLGFLRNDLVPKSVAEEGTGMMGWLSWAWDVLQDRALLASAQTIGLAIVAIVIASSIAALLATVAARVNGGIHQSSRARRNHCEDPGQEVMDAGACSTPMPHAPPGKVPSQGMSPWIPKGLRLGFSLTRSLPEYLLAFLLVAILPHSPWPAVLALVLHNGGILGRLFSETLENVPSQPADSLRASGASALHANLVGRWPAAFTRAVSLSFYRFETCVRDATVLGMVGIGSIGFLVVEARARQDTPEQFLLVLCGAAIVLCSDLLSRLVRRHLREG